METCGLDLHAYAAARATDGLCQSHDHPVTLLHTTGPEDLCIIGYHSIFDSVTSERLDESVIM